MNVDIPGAPLAVEVVPARAERLVLLHGPEDTVVGLIKVWLVGRPVGVLCQRVTLTPPPGACNNLINTL